MLGHAPHLAGNKSNVTTNIDAGLRPASDIDSSHAWMRLLVALALGTIGSVGMWSFVVALPAVQADFGVARGEASLPFTLTMIGFGAGGIVMGRLADRFGIVLPVVCGAITLGVGYMLSGIAGNLWQVQVETGSRVQAGDVLVILESMKMEIPLLAPMAGVVLEIRVQPGSAVRAGQRVVVLELD